MRPTKLGTGATRLTVIGLIVSLSAACTTTSGVGVAAVAVRGDTIVGVGGTRGNRGTLAIAVSSDGGATWDIAVRPTPALTHIAWAGERLIGSTICMAPSAGGTALEPEPTTCLFASHDLGRTWLDLQAGRLVDPTFADANYGWAYPPYPIGTKLFETSDGGATWTEFAQPCEEATPQIQVAVATGPRAGYVVCLALPDSDPQPWTLIELEADGNVAVRLEGAVRYSEEDPGLLDAWIRGLTMRSDGTGLLMANGLYQTADHGRTWVEVHVSGTDDSSFSGGTMISEQVAYLAGGNGNWTAIVRRAGDQFRTLIRWPVMGGPAVIPTP